MFNFLKNHFKFIFCILWFTYVLVSIQHSILGEIKLNREYGELNYKWLLYQVRQCNPYTSEHKDMLELNRVGEEYRAACKRCEELGIK